MTTLNLTYNDVLGAYSQYPAPIRPYLTRTETHPALRRSLTKSFMRVLVDVVARAPIKNAERTIKLRVDVISDKLEISTKTVSRALAFMREQGWITIAPGTDRRNNRGEYSYSEYTISAQLRELIGLPIQDKNLTGQIKEQETEMSDGLYKVNKVFKKEASFNRSPSAKTKYKIPADLTILQTKYAISFFGICKLMKLAKEANQRLQDVLKIKEKYLQAGGLMKGRAFNYLAKILTTGEDFSFVARKQTISAPTKTGDSKDYRHFFDKKFAGQKGVLVKIHGDGSGIDLTNGRQNYISPGDMMKVFEIIEAGKLWRIDE